MTEQLPGEGLFEFYAQQAQAAEETRNLPNTTNQGVTP